MQGKPLTPESPPDGGLTGAKRYRVGFGKKLVLQVEVARYDYSLPWELFKKKGVKSYWRDATVQDISTGEIV